MHKYKTQMRIAGIEVNSPADVINLSQIWVQNSLDSAQVEDLVNSVSQLDKSYNDELKLHGYLEFLMTLPGCLGYEKFEKLYDYECGLAIDKVFAKFPVELLPKLYGYIFDHMSGEVLKEYSTKEFTEACIESCSLEPLYSLLVRNETRSHVLQLLVDADAVVRMGSKAISLLYYMNLDRNSNEDRVIEFQKLCYQHANLKHMAYEKLSFFESNEFQRQINDEMCTLAGKSDPESLLHYLAPPKDMTREIAITSVFPTVNEIASIIDGPGCFYNVKDFYCRTFFKYRAIAFEETKKHLNTVIRRWNGCEIKSKYALDIEDFSVCEVTEDLFGKEKTILNGPSKGVVFLIQLSSSDLPTISKMKVCVGNGSVLEAQGDVNIEDFNYAIKANDNLDKFYNTVQRLKESAQRDSNVETQVSLFLQGRQLNVETAVELKTGQLVTSDTLKELYQVDIASQEKPPFIVNFSNTVSAFSADYDCAKGLHLSPMQTKCVLNAATRPFSLVSCAPGTGAKQMIASLLYIYRLNNVHERIVVVSNNAVELGRIYDRCIDAGIPRESLFNLENATHEVSQRYELVHNLLGQVATLAKCIGESEDHAQDCQSSSYFFNAHIKTVWANFIKDVQSNKDLEFPFIKFFPDWHKLLPTNSKLEDTLKYYVDCYSTICNIFTTIESLRPLELLSKTNVEDYLVNKQASILFTTGEKIPLCDRIIVHNSHLLDNHQLVDYLLLKSKSITMVGSSGENLFGIASKTINLQVLDTRVELLGPNGVTALQHRSFNPGFVNTIENIKVPATNSLQNVESAEYAVSLYAYLRLLGYPCDKIAIVAFNAAQCALIDEIADTRLVDQRDPTPDDSLKEFRFGRPAVYNCASYIPRYDYIIADSTNALSTLGHCAKLGLYTLSPNGNALPLVLGEFYSTSIRASTPRTAEMVNAAHMEAYIKQMTQTRLRYKN